MHPIFTAFLAQTGSNGPSQAPGGGLLASPLVMIALMFVIFYFVVFRPQSRQRKQHDEMVSKLQKGDEIITQAGIYGTVSAVNGDGTVMVDIGGGTKVRLVQSFIQRNITREAAAKAAAGAKAEAKK